MGWYAMLCGSLNRCFSTLIALSLVAACNKWGFETLAGYNPTAPR